MQGESISVCNNERRRKLLDAAADEFIKSGYGATTVESIARRAGMSKKTVYKVFESKQALFDAVLQDKFFSLCIPKDEIEGDQEQVLVGLLLAMAKILLQPDRLALLRLIVADSPAAPELSNAFGRINMGEETNHLERWLEQEVHANRLKPMDVKDNADFLFGITLAKFILMGIIGDERGCCGAALEQRTRRGVRLFLDEMRAV